MTANPKPCRFCGDTRPVVMAEYDYDGDISVGYVACNECKARGPEVRVEEAVPLESMTTSPQELVVVLALERWNRRR